VQIFGKHLIEAAQKKHANWKGSLGSWVRIVEGVDPPWNNFPAVRRTRKDADPVGDCVIFDIKNNEARLISYISYEMGTVIRQRGGGKVPAIAERLPAKYLVKAEAPKIIASREQHEAYIQRLLELQRKAHRTAEETETAKLLVVLIADYEAKQFTIEKASGVEVLRELMDANGLRQKDLADDLGGESIVSLILKGKRQLNRQQMEKLSHRFHVSPAVFF
jgi:HTH-type transcriptional regulator/antitoxin HigA